MLLIGTAHIDTDKNGQIYVFNGYARIRCSTMDAAVGQYHRLLTENWLTLFDQQRLENLGEYNEEYLDEYFNSASQNNITWLIDLSEAVENKDIIAATKLIEEGPKPDPAPGP